jgi:hypothetical protein
VEICGQNKELVPDVEVQHSIVGARIGAVILCVVNNNRFFEFLPALRDSFTVSLRLPSEYHVEVGARRLP